MDAKTKTLLTVLGFSVVDMLLPIPILGIILIYVILQKPPWFKEMMRDVYDE